MPLPSSNIAWHLVYSAVTFVSPLASLTPLTGTNMQFDKFTSRKRLLLRLVLILLCTFSLGAYQTSAPPVQIPDLPLNLDEQLNEYVGDNLSGNPLPASDMARVAALEGLSQSTSVAEWLGPMAPIALSPFFGIACLALLSQFGADWIPGNAFLSDNAILNDPLVLWIFVGLTLLTSLPRLTKVSKPMAQAIDQIETYAAIITILIIRWYAGSTESSPDVAMAEFQVVNMGFFSFTTDALLSVAAIINILVINSVKFFCEVMVWLTPFPFVDALLEAGNKTLCAGLIAIYAYSPFIATIINLILFAICLILFRWSQRRVAWLRSVLVDPIRARLQPSYGQPTGEPLIVFAQKSFGPFPAKARIELQSNEDGWRLTQRKWFFPDSQLQLDGETSQLNLMPGIVTNRVVVTGPESGSLLFTQRYGGSLETLSQQIAVRYDRTDTRVTDTAIA